MYGKIRHRRFVKLVVHVLSAPVREVFVEKPG
jgi:hypothetical protein